MGATYYAQCLRDFDWEWAKVQCVDNANDTHLDLIENGHTIDEDGTVFPCWGPEGGDELYGMCFLGTRMSLAPSGKYWTAWAHSNVTRKEVEKDSAWFTALFHAAAKHGGWIRPGEDPCDLFFCMIVTPGEFLKEEDNDHS